MPIVSIIVQVNDEENVDIIRTHLEEQANQISQATEPQSFDEETVSWEVEDN
jgi:hypothetical protein